MRVLALAQTTAQTSGWGRYAHAVIGEYARQGLEYKILTVGKGSGAPHEFPALSTSGGLRGLIRNVFSVLSYGKGSDVIHAYDMWPFGVYAYLATRLTRKPYFITGVATYSVAPADRPIKRWLMLQAYKHAKAVLAVSEYTKKRIVERVPHINAEVVYWGPSHLPILTPQEEAEQSHKFSFIKEKSPFLLTVGQIKHRKGQYDVLRAVEKLRNAYPNIFYAMVGSDDERGYMEKIRSFAKEKNLEGNYRVVTDAHDDQALSYLYSKSDIFLLTSNNEGDHFEGFGLVMLEAEQFGKPVIGTRDCGVEEALRDGYNGYLVSQGDENDIAEAVEKILGRDKAELERNSKSFASQFSWEKTVSKYIELYSQSL